MHLLESVNWLAIESGSWSSDEGSMIQAGMLEVEGDMATTGLQWATVEFVGAGFPGTLPAVVTQCMSYYGSDWVKTRQQQGDNTFFSVSLEEEGGLEGHGCTSCSSSAHTNWEEVGWVAVEPAVGNLGTEDYEAGLTGLSVTHQDYLITFAHEFTNAPRVFAAMQTYLGTDSSEIRQRGVASTTDVTIFVEEESCSDTEINHVAEIVGYMAFESGGLLLAQSTLNLGCRGIYDATSAQLSGAELNEGGAIRPAGTVGSGFINFMNADGDSATWDLHRCSSSHVYHSSNNV